jgi:hypothetical protein
LTTYDSAGKAEECIFLAYLDQDYGYSLPILPPSLGDNLGGDIDKNFVTFVRDPSSDDTYAFSLKSFCALQVPDAAVAGAVIRGARRNSVS